MTKLRIRVPTEAEITEGARIGAIEHEFDARTLRFDEKNDVLNLGLYNGVHIAIPRSRIKWLADLPLPVAKKMRLGSLGAAIEIRSRDIDISVSGMIGHVTGNNWPSRAGSVKSEAKAAASRANGARGGRPRETAAVVAKPKKQTLRRR
jgi:hypothetical protein